MKKILISFFILFSLCAKVQAKELSFGLDLIQNGNYDSAEEFFKDWTKNNPNDPTGLYWYGFCLKKNGQTELSRLYMEKSFKLSGTIDEPDFRQYIKNLQEDDLLDIAGMYLETNNIAKALVYTDMTLSLNPDCARAYFIRAQIFMAQKDEMSANKALSRAIQGNSNYLNTELAKELNITTVPDFDVDYYNSVGLKAFYDTDLAAARRYFELALKKDPKNAASLNYLAQTEMKAGNLEGAKSILKKAQFVNSKYIKTYLNLANIAHLQANSNNTSALQKQKFELEEKINLKTALSINPNDKYVYLALGNFDLSKKDFEGAKKNFETAIILDEDFYEAHFGLAKIYMETNNSQNALLALRKAASLNEASTEVTYSIAKMCIEEGKLDEAQDYLSNLVKEAQVSDYYLELGKVYFLKEDYQSAENAFNKALSLGQNTNFDELYYYLSKTKLKLYDADGALEAIKKPLEKEPKSIKYNYALSLIQKELKDEATMAQALDVAFNKPLKTPEDFIERTEVFIEEGKIKQANKTVEKGLLKYPDNSALKRLKSKLLVK